MSFLFSLILLILTLFKYYIVFNPILLEFNVYIKESLYQLDYYCKNNLFTKKNVFLTI